MRLRLPLCLALCMVAGALCAATVELQPNAVVANGVTPGADVVFFGVALEPDGYGSQIEQWAQIVKSTGTTARLELAAPVPYKSMWAVVDLDTGDFALSSPAGYTAKPAIIPKKLLKKGSGDASDLLTEGREFVQLLLVTPKKGAWQFTAMDGDGDDDGRDDGQIAASLEHFRPVDASKAPPKKLSKNDVVIMFDYNRMEAWAFSTGDEMLRSADETH